MRITVPVILAVTVSVALVGSAQSVAPPPQPLQLVGDHWTPYDPPADFPEGSQVHIIERGDTLWDLAHTYLGDPYLWPQLWERNPYIKDSHWIYPGDPIVIDLAVQEPIPVEEAVEEIMVEEEPEIEGVEELDLGADSTGVPHPLGTSSDIYCFARLVDDESVFKFSVVSAERIGSQDHFSENDILYIDGGVADGIQAGDQFFVLHREKQLDHPVSRSSMGVIYTYAGQIKILCAQEDSSIAQVTFLCDFISLGDVLLPYRPIPVPLVINPEPTTICDAANGKPTGYTIYARDDVMTSAAGQVLMVDLGAAEGLYPGQFATVFRDNPVAGMPRILLGEIGVLTVEDSYSTVVISRSMESMEPILIGDRIEMK